MNPPRTPPAQSHVFAAQKETPSRPRQSFSSRYRAGHLSDARSVVIEDLGDIPLVSVEFFTSNVLPPIRDNVLGNIKASLVAKKLIEENRWSAFPQSPKATGLVETRAFSAFPTMVDHIVQTASTLMDSEPTLKFVCKPNVAPVSERNNSTRPDGQLELKKKKSVGEVSSSDEKSHWEDIVVPCEFKIDNNDYHDNVSKLIWSAHHIMRTDPLRRFTFGITVEDTEMRLWFFARSHVMVSHPFNFVTEHDIVIRIFAGLAFADDESLGFDSTVSRVLVDNQIRYKYEVGGESYITTRTLADHAADFIRGRGTRVFEALHESNASRPVVVKDVWLEDDRIEEGVHLENIRAAITQFQTEGTIFPGSRDPSTYFLTIVAHGRVKVDGQTEDHTTNVMMCGSGLPSDLEYFSTSKRRVPQVPGSRVIESDRGYSVGHTPVVSRDHIAALILTNVPRKVRRFQARIHYRIVFDEVGKTIHDLCNLSEVYQCLADATTALEIMHIVGYVHRDVSAGNILFWNGTGVLSDLESAKKTTDLSTHEVRTGTNQYESVEVREQKYIFVEDEYDNDDNDVQAPFKFNCLHDLESAWWIALWVLFHHIPLGDDEDHSAQTEQAAELFPSVGTSSSRIFTFMKGIKPLIQYLPRAFQLSARDLIKARAGLVHHYKLAEKGSSINETAFVGIHEKLRAIWLKAQSESTDIEYTFVPQAKRGATDEASAIPGSSKRPKINPSIGGASKKPQVKPRPTLRK